MQRLPDEYEFIQLPREERRRVIEAVVRDYAEAPDRDPERPWALCRRDLLRTLYWLFVKLHRGERIDDLRIPSKAAEPGYVPPPLHPPTKPAGTEPPARRVSIHG